MLGHQAGRLARKPAHDRVDQRPVAPDPLSLDQRHCAVDCGMGRRAEKGELGGADPEDVLDRRRSLGQPTIEASGNQNIDLAEPA